MKKIFLALFVLTAQICLSMDNVENPPLEEKIPAELSNDSMLSDLALVDVPYNEGVDASMKKSEIPVSMESVENLSLTEIMPAETLLIITRAILHDPSILSNNSMLRDLALVDTRFNEIVKYIVKNSEIPAVLQWKQAKAHKKIFSYLANVPNPSRVVDVPKITKMVMSNCSNNHFIITATEAGDNEIGIGMYDLKTRSLVRKFDYRARLLILMDLHLLNTPYIGKGKQKMSPSAPYYESNKAANFMEGKIIDSMVLSSDDKILITCSSITRELCIWDVDSGKYITSFEDQDAILAINPDLSSFITLAGNNVNVWTGKLRSGKCEISHTMSFYDSVKHVYVSPDYTKLFATVSSKNIVFSIDGKSLEEAVDGFNFSKMAVSPDGKFIATIDTASIPKNILIYDASTKQLLRTLIVPSNIDPFGTGTISNEVSCLRFNHDNSLLLCGTNTGEGTLWDVQNGTLVMELPLLTDRRASVVTQVIPMDPGILFMAMSHDAKYLAVGVNEYLRAKTGTLKLYKI